MADKRIRRTFSPAFKARAVCELLKGDRTVAQVASELNVHPNLLTKWKQLAMEKMPTLFANEGQHTVADLKADYEDPIQNLYAEIGRLTTQLSWVKKNVVSTVGKATRRSWVADDPALSLTAQAALAGISRASLYYEPVPPTPDEIAIKHLIDEWYTEMPFLGSRKFTEMLRKRGYA